MPLRRLSRLVRSLPPRWQPRRFHPVKLPNEDRNEREKAYRQEDHEVSAYYEPMIRSEHKDEEVINEDMKEGAGKDVPR